MNWGVPDWRLAEGYEGERTLREWWWEFTRRRPDYRELWLQARPLQEKWVEANLDWCGEIAKTDGCTLEEAIDWKRSRHVPNGQIREVQRRFRLSAIPDPRVVFDEHFLRHVFYSDRATAVRYGRFDAVEKDQSGSFILMRFNLDRPIEEQLAFAKDYLKQMQEYQKGKAITRRPRQSNWPIFLRALDARDADATLGEMAEVLWPGQTKTAQSARDTYEAACELRDNFPI